MIQITNPIAKLCRDLQHPGIDYPALLEQITPGSQVTIWVPAGKGMRGQEWSLATGKAIMRHNRLGSWALNMGGTHGRPGVADLSNLVNVVPHDKRKPVIPWNHPCFQRFQKKENASARD